jgi:uncharacterized membrane protein YccF (DUF307 family)
MIALVLNLLWLICGGLWMAAAWLFAGAIMALTVAGLPRAFGAFNIARFTLTPFGHVAVRRDWYLGHETLGNGPVGALGNMIWLVIAGWWLALGHLVVALLLAITVIGLPLAWAHFKLAGLALWPIGREIVSFDHFVSSHG